MLFGCTCLRKIPIPLWIFDWALPFVHLLHLYFPWSWKTVFLERFLRIFWPVRRFKLLGNITWPLKIKALKIEIFFKKRSILKAPPHKDRLTPLHAICLHISRHFCQKKPWHTTVCLRVFWQSDEKSDCASHAQSLCGVALTWKSLCKKRLNQLLTLRLCDII